MIVSLFPGMERKTNEKGELVMKHKSLNQLLCAATVNHRFRETLLHDPAQAIATGYCNQAFALTPEEQELVVGIQAQQLEDFAAQVYRWISANSNGNGHNGNGHNSLAPAEVKMEPLRPC